MCSSLSQCRNEGCGKLIQLLTQCFATQFRPQEEGQISAYLSLRVKEDANSAEGRRIPISAYTDGETPIPHAQRKAKGSRVPITAYTDANFLAAESRGWRVPTTAHTDDETEPHKQMRRENRPVQRGRVLITAHTDDETLPAQCKMRKEKRAPVRPTPGRMERLSNSFGSKQ